MKRLRLRNGLSAPGLNGALRKCLERIRDPRKRGGAPSQSEDAVRDRKGAVRHVLQECLDELAPSLP